MTDKNTYPQFSNTSIPSQEDKTFELNELKASMDRNKEAFGVSLAEFDIIFNNTDRAIRIINQDFTIRRINRAFAHLTGLDPEQVMGRKCYEVYPGPFCHTPLSIS